MKPVTQERLPARLGEFQLLVRRRATAAGELFVARAPSRKKSGGLCFVQSVSPGFESERRLRRAFEAERARPRGEGLTNLFDAGVIEGVGFFAYEFGDEISLEFLEKAARDSGSSLPWSGAVQFGIELLDALDILHSSQYPSPHADVRPDNVFISRKGRVVLGRAQPFWAVAPEKVLGFDVFVPPELRFCAHKNADARKDGLSIDLWGAAATIWGLLFHGTRHPNPALGACGPSSPARGLGAPAELDVFFEKALSPSPKARFDTAAQMRAVLLSCREQVGKYTAEQTLRRWFLSHGESEIISGRNLISERIRIKTETRYVSEETEEAPGQGSLLANRYRLGGLIAQDETVRSYEAKDEAVGDGDGDKVIHVFGGVADPNALRRLRRRVGEAVCGNHPAMARVDWMGATDNGSVFLVMSRWTGQRLNWFDASGACEKDLPQHLREQRTPPRRRVSTLLAGAAGGAVVVGLGAVLAWHPPSREGFAGSPLSRCEDRVTETAQADTGPRGTWEQSVTVLLEDTAKDDVGADVPRQVGAAGSSSKKSEAMLAPAVQAKRLLDEGRRLFRASRLDEAEALLQRAAKIAAHRAEIPYLRGKIAFQEGRYAQASDLIERAVAMNPRRLAWRNYLGKVYLAMGDRVRASKQWERVLREDPDNEEARRYAGFEGQKDARRGPSP